MQLAINRRTISAMQLSVFAAAALLMLITGCALNENSPNGDPQFFTELVVLSKSIGRGVPKTTQQKFDSIKQLLTSEGIDTHVSIWGIEGEQRLCAVLSKQALARMTPDIEQISIGVPLLEVTYRQAPAEADKHCKQ